MTSNLKRLGIVSIAPPNMSDSIHFYKQPIRIENKIKLDARNSREQSIVAISPLDDYTSIALSENNIKSPEIKKKTETRNKSDNVDLNLIKKSGGAPLTSLCMLDSIRQFNGLNNETSVYAPHLNQLEFSDLTSKRRNVKNSFKKMQEIKIDNKISHRFSQESPPVQEPRPIEDKSKYITPIFNWIHYLLLNDDLIENNIITDASAFEHWEKVGIKEQRTSIIKTNNMKKYAKLYIKLKDKNPRCFDKSIENAIKFKESDVHLFNKYPNLFHKYLLKLRDPEENLVYNVTKIVEIKKKYVCAIHCYDLNVFEEYFADYLTKIKELFDVIVTYCVHNEIVLLNNKFLFICMKNKGMDLGGKFVSMDYLTKHKIDYEYIFFIHSKTNKYMRDNYIFPFISNLNKISGLLNCGEIGGIFPNVLNICHDDLNVINYEFFKTINNLKYEKITWSVNEIYVNEMSKYFGIQSESYIFASGNCYILHKSVAKNLFGNKYIQNILNCPSSFDYNWVNIYYKFYKDRDSVYKKYRLEKLYGNHIETVNCENRMADAMIEHAFERIVMALVLQMNRPIKILNGKDFTMSIIENYMNSFNIKKNKEMDFITLKEYMFEKIKDFDWELYLLLNPDLIGSGIKNKNEAIKHWNLHGKKEGRIYTDPDFNWEIYLLLNKDLTKSGVSTKLAAVQHWINHGKKEGRLSYDPNFIWKEYILLNADLEKNGINTEILAYNHWIKYGKSEGRECKIYWENTSEFDWKFYADMYPDLKQNGIILKEQLYSHWINHGKSENRIFSMQFYKNIYDKFLTNKFEVSNSIIKLNNIKKINETNNHYITSSSMNETIKNGEPLFKNMKIIDQVDLFKFDSFILVVDFNLQTGGAYNFLNTIINLYKPSQSFLIVRQFSDFLYFYVNDDFIVKHKYTTETGVRLLTELKSKIKKIFINSIVSHSFLFLKEIFNFGKPIAAITHDYSLVFDFYHGYYHDLILKKYSSPIDINKLDLLITQNEANLNVHSKHLSENLSITITELPDHKYSLRKIDTKNKKTVIGILGHITEFKGISLVHEMIKKYNKHEDIDIIIFGGTAIPISNAKIIKYSNVDELNARLIEHKPNLWLDTGLCPETYSYTLTLMMLTQLPILYQKKTFPSTITNRLSEYKSRVEYKNIEDLLSNIKLITNLKQNYFYTIDTRIYSNVFWDSYFSKEILLEKNKEKIITFSEVNTKDKAHVFETSDNIFFPKKVEEKCIEKSCNKINVFSNDEFPEIDLPHKKKNIVFISSKIYTSDKKFTYTDKRSIYTTKERFAQTIQTISSIKKYIKNVFIILVDNSTFTYEEYNTLNFSVDVFLNITTNRVVNEYTDDKTTKLYGELAQTALMAHFLKENASNIKCNQFFKISGRYLVNQNFDFKIYDNNDNIFKKNEKVVDREYYYTSMYKIGGSNLFTYIDTILNMFNESVGNTTYDGKEWEMVLHDKIKKYKTVDCLGITQNISVWDQKDDI